MKIKSVNRHATNAGSVIVRKLVLLLLVFSFAGCGSIISTFDQYAYVQTTSLKVDALNLMGQATDSFTLHAKDLAEVKLNLQKVYEYERNRPKNEITIQQWNILLNPEGHLLGGFLKRWEDKSVLGATFVDEEKKIISEAFDQIAGLESGKIKK